MTDFERQSSFRGLPLTPEQNAEIRHYIKVKERRGEPWDTPELNAMLKDMLEPPGEDEEEESGTSLGHTRVAAERAAAVVDDAVDPIEISEELNAARELEAMKAQGL